MRQIIVGAALILTLCPVTAQDIFVANICLEDSEPDGCYLVIFTARYCGPCQRVKRDELPKLERVGHKVTIVDIDEEDQWKVDRVPTFWVVDRRTKKTVKTFVGFTRAETLLPLLKVREVSKGKTVTQSVPGPAQNQVKVSDSSYAVGVWRMLPETWPAVVPIIGTTRYSKQTVLWHRRGGGNGGTNHNGDAYHSWPLDELTVGQLATIHDADHGIRNGLELPK